VDAYLAGPKQEADAEPLQKKLAMWSDNAKTVRPTLESNSLLLENISIADSLVRLCQAGQEAFSSLSSQKAASSEWKQRNLAAIGDATKPQANMLIQIAPAIQKLVEAVQTAP
jgi:hypothetical protein